MAEVANTMQMRNGMGECWRILMETAGTDAPLTKHEERVTAAAIL